MTRLGHGEPAAWVWLPVSAVAGSALLALAALWWRRGARDVGVLLAAGAMLLCSPISWDHHFVWAAPLLLVLARRTPKLVLVAVAALLVVGLRPLVTHGDHRELDWQASQQLVGNGYTWLVLGFAVAAAVAFVRASARRLDPAGHLAEREPAARCRRRRVAQHHLVAVLAGTVWPSAPNGSAPPHDSSRNEPRWSRSGPLIVPEANRSPVRSEAPLTVMWASIWAGDQYIVRYGGRLTTVAVELDLDVDVEAAGRARPEVGQRLRVLAGEVDPGRVEGGQRRHPGRDRRGERLAEERPERHVLPGLDVARRPVVEAGHAEDVVGEAGDRHRRPERRRRTDDEAELGLDVESLSGPEGRRRVAGRLRCPLGR